MSLKWPTRVAGLGLKFAPKRLQIHRHMQLHFRNISTIPEIKSQKGNIAKFKRDFFDTEKPLVLRGEAASFPAIKKWFETCRWTEKTLLSDDFNPTTMFPYEIMSTTDGVYDLASIIDTFHQYKNRQTGLERLINSMQRHANGSPEQEMRFIRFQCPVELLRWVLRGLPWEDDKTPKLYIAQANLSDVLDAELLKDVPVPDLVKQSGKGDIYDSSLWMGLEPTFTPWHRDPNHNFFCQLRSTKAVRILPPNRGKTLFTDVVAKADPSNQWSPQIRGEEMMKGVQRKALMDAVWGGEAPDTIQETVLQPGDALFLPKGWWHSLKSGGDDGELNASVNWWFR